MVAFVKNIRIAMCTLGTVASLVTAAPVSMNRFGLIVGSNMPGGGRGSLKYAVRDAEGFASVLQELGGVESSHLVIVSDPRKKTLLEAFTELDRLVRKKSADDAREEVVFYYSGHADATGLLLGNEVFEYAALRKALNDIPADVHVAVMDACASGAMTRTKGGTRRPAFLFDASSAMEGHAYLTSSSHDEVAQESDQIKGSFFTHYLVSGLRGGADFDLDGRVTLNEAYTFAFDETLKRTERTYAGPQHPSYDIRLKGSGDLVMTDLRAGSAGLRLSEQMFGNLFVRDPEGNLLVEIRKRPGKPMELGLRPGTYQVTLERPATRLATTVSLSSGEFTDLGDSQMELVAMETTVTRGGTVIDVDSLDENERLEAERQAYKQQLALKDSTVKEGALATTSGAEGPNGASAELDTVPFSFEILPSSLSSRRKEVRQFSINLLWGRYYELHGVGVGLIGQRAENRVTGVQAGIIGTWSGGELLGIQASSIGNVTLGSARAIQLANIMNYAEKDFTGGQLSHVGNYAQAVQGIQATNVANVSSQNVIGGQISNVANVAGGVTGAQFTNVANVNYGHLAGVQVSNVVNYSKGVYGAQIANVVNISTGDVKGAQISSVSNIARDVNGAQVGLISNTARDLSGVQLSLLANSARNVTGGAQISLLVNAARHSDGFLFGALNLIRDGELHPGMYLDESGLVNFTFRSGNKHWYGLLCAALQAQPEDDSSRVVTTGLGWGGSLPIGRFMINLDLSSHVVGRADNLFTEPPNHLNRVRLSAGFKMFEHLIPFAGVSLNALHRYGDGRMVVYEGETYSLPKYEGTKWWPGFFAGIEF